MVKLSKKRKHAEQSDNGQSDLTENSLPATTEAPCVETSPTRAKAKKIKEKRKKATDRRAAANDSDADDAGDAIDGADAEALHEPTLEELRECEKPENTNAILTIRQKKKRKYQERLEAQNAQTAGKEKQRNADYLTSWKTARSEWKFEKLRQISIQQSVFDEEKIAGDIWPIALEYLSGSKGAAREKITKLAEQLIEQLDGVCQEQDNEEARRAILESAKYQRARDLLQSFD